MIPRGHLPSLLAPPVAALVWLATVPSATPQPYIDWAAGSFTAAERAAGEAAPRRDPDRDGWPNLLEYALGTHPRDFRSHPAPSFPGGGDPSACCPLAAGDRAAGLRMLLSADLTDWHPAPALTGDQETLTAPLGEMRFLRLEAFALPGHPIDSDGDGLHDLFEEQLAAASPSDAIDGIADVNPLDDHDADGTPNIDEPENLRPAGCGFPTPPLLDPAAVADAADAADNGTPVAAPALSVHTPLR